MKKNDEKVKELLAKVNKQKEELGDKPKFILNSNGLFEYDDTKCFNINTVSDPYVLVEAMAFLVGKLDFYKFALDELQMKYDKKFSWCGYDYEAWKDDFKNRINVIKWEEKKKNLDATQKKLDSLVSEELRTEVMLDEIDKMLN